MNQKYPVILYEKYTRYKSFQHKALTIKYIILLYQCSFYVKKNIVKRKRVIHSLLTIINQKNNNKWEK